MDAISQSNSMAQAINQFKHLKDLENFRRVLQKGDLGLAKLIQYAFVLYGQTKTGKTTTSHLLAGNPLRSEKQNGEEILKPTTSRDRDARIGNNQLSETTTPNFFKVNLRNAGYNSSQTFVVDTPGYGDSYGVLRILSNGYFHYRLYSKTRNMKFIICFDRIHLSNTAGPFIDTLRQFTQSFQNYEDEKYKIWESCVFLITKVPESQNTMADLQDKLKVIARDLMTQFDKSQQQSLKEFISYIVRKKKFFYIKKYSKGETAHCSGLLQRIDENVKNWWSRKYDSDKQIVDMTPISFSLAKRIVISSTTEVKSNQQFKELINYYNGVINNLVCIKRDREETKGSLSKVIYQLINDAMGDPDSHNYLNMMEDQVNKNYKKYDLIDEEKRKIKQKQLFSNTEEKSEEKSHSSKKITKNSCTFTLKKFKVLKEIEKFKQQIYGKQFERSMKWLQQCMKSVYKILKSFNKVSYKKIKCQQVIYKYGYIIHRILEEAKLFFLLIEDSCPKPIQKQLKDIVETDLIIDISRPLRDFMGVEFSYNQETTLKYQNLKDKFVKNFKVTDDELEKLTIDQEFIDFFLDQNKEKQNADLGSQLKIHKSQQKAQKIETQQEKSQRQKEQAANTLKVVKMLIKYSTQVLQENLNVPLAMQNQLLDLVRKLIPFRVKSQDLYQLQSDEELKEEFMISVIEITKNIAKILDFSGIYQEAREVYSTILYVKSVCDIYEKEILELDKLKELKNVQKKSILRRIEYSRYLTDHLQVQKAISVLQDAYQKAYTNFDRNIISEELSNLNIGMQKENRVLNYQQKLFAHEYFENFSEELEQKLLLI